MNVEFESNIAHKSEVEFSQQLFYKFLRELPSFYHPILGKTIPFSYCYFWFSWRKIDKRTARKIVRQWVSLGFCRVVPYHGLKISSNFKNKVLEEGKKIKERIKLETENAMNSAKEQDEIYFQLREELVKILKGEKK